MAACRQLGLDNFRDDCGRLQTQAHFSAPRPRYRSTRWTNGLQTVLLKALGKGVQIYECKAKPGDPDKFEWSFKAPEANLTNEHGEKIAKHYAGPTWEANDGSKVVGEVQKKAPAPRPGAIPWLLLKAKTNEGTGTFARVTYIQRVDTEGGVAPAAGCDQAHVNTEARVDYRANYYFYAPRR